MLGLGYCATFAVNILYFINQKINLQKINVFISIQTNVVIETHCRMAAVEKAKVNVNECVNVHEILSSIESEIKCEIKEHLNDFGVKII